MPSAHEPYICPSPCDDDCEALCHECHAVTWKREHDVASCEMTVRLHRNPVYLAAVEEVEREIEADRLAGRAPTAVDLDEMFARYRAARATNRVPNQAPVVTQEVGLVPASRSVTSANPNSARSEKPGSTPSPLSEETP